MSISPPFFASALQARIPVELEVLYQSSRTHVSDADKLLGIELLIEAYCDLVDTCFVGLINEIQRTHESKDLTEAHRILDEIKDKARHYLRWIATFIAKDRLPPVIEHFYRLMHTLDIGGTKPFMAFNLSPTTAVEIKRVVTTLEAGTATDFNDAIEMLILVIEEVMVPLVIEPKELMKFNFVVNKTLDGVIALVRVLFKRMLRKLAPKLPQTLYPQIAAHLKTFLIV